ncbi:MAG TPA: bifunctional FO biosynthesis protein CofGH [Mycobacteriales bacterium]|nr:bifunctional FO biosynthesis protein CofGH [Mycobacteriales bacterium]
MDGRREPAGGPGSIAAPDRSALRRALRRARDSAALDATEAEVLLHARGDDLTDLMASAARVRDAGLLKAGRPGTVTYSRKVFIPLTRLCRDRCHYCTFATVPGRLPAPYLSPDEVIAIAAAGAAQGCKEALFTLGDAPEDRWPQARQWLDEQGYDDTLSYVRAMAVRVLEETGLLPHLNPGVMSWADLTRLKPVAVSMGLMVETVATRLWSEPGGPHYGSPDKEPAKRLAVVEDAGRLAIPFTTGLLIGIGETYAETVEGLLALRRTAREHRHVQEVLVQNFRAKDDTAMARHPDADEQAYLATLAVARLLLGPGMRLQAPPNLASDVVGPDLDHGFVGVRRLLDAGVDDLGGISPVTPDHVNPERPWPQLDALTADLAQHGWALAERLAVHPEYVRSPDPWLDPRVQPHVRALADPSGLARADTLPAGRPWQEPDTYSDGAWTTSGRADLHVAIDTEGRTGDRRSDFDDVYGDWDEIGLRLKKDGAASAPARLDADVSSALRSAERDPAGLSDDDALALMTADGAALDAVCTLADQLRRDVVGDDVTFVVNRNINFTNVCYTGCRFCAFAQRRTDADAYTLSLDEVAERAAEAWDVGATEVCMQGGIHPDLPGTAYASIAQAVKARTPDMHIHAFSPMEVMNGVARTGLSIRELLISLKEAGVGSLPGTAAEILDDDVRWVLTKGKLPTAQWIEVVRTAHEVGIPTTSTMMYGHVDTPAHWVAHIKLLARLQAETGGFTEFVPLPFVHANAPVYLAGLARPGPTARDDRAVHALARLLLHGRIDNIQCSWVKLGDAGVRVVLAGGVNDLGGTLMEETISRMAGAENGSRRSVAELEAMAAGAGRPTRQRTTLYGPVSDERLLAARRAELPLVATAVSNTSRP